MFDWRTAADTALNKTLTQGSGRSMSNFQLHPETRMAVLDALAPVFENCLKAVPQVEDLQKQIAEQAPMIEKLKKLEAEMAGGK